MSDEKPENADNTTTPPNSAAGGENAAPEAAADWGDALKEQKAAETANAASPTPQGAADEWAAALSEQKKTEAAPKENPPATAERFPLENLKHEPQGGGSDHSNLEVILDIPVVISMEVGKTRISIRNLMKLAQGSVVELDRFAGDALDVYVNGTLIAHGEVVVVNEKFGIRLTDIISASERIDKLG